MIRTLITHVIPCPTHLALQYHIKSLISSRSLHIYIFQLGAPKVINTLITKPLIKLVPLTDTHSPLKLSLKSIYALEL